MGRVDTSLKTLQPVALLAVLGYKPVAVRHLGPFEAGRWRLAVCRTHIGPDHATHLHHRVRDGLDFGVIVAVLCLVHHVKAVTRHVELPAMINTAQTALFVAAQKK